jgi:hypothetical protein
MEDWRSRSRVNSESSERRMKKDQFDKIDSIEEKIEEYM